jgi:hypothetical protein
MFCASIRSWFESTRLAFAAVLVALAASSAIAGNTLSVDWSSIDAGGGTKSTPIRYSLPAAATSS